MNTAAAAKEARPYSITAAELSQLGAADIPPELQTDARLIYNSPAALDFNSPGAEGFGVKRAGLAIPGSIMLLISPRCCGRNTAALGADGALADRFAYLLLDENDIVTGKHLSRIPEAVRAFAASRRTAPTCVLLCLTCVDALLGTDMERVAKKATAYAGLPVLPCYMYALTRESTRPPMSAVRETVYSLLAPRRRVPTSVNLLGFFAPIAANAEIRTYLRQLGLKTIRQLPQVKDFADYEAMAEANFNLVLNGEARGAAAMLEKKLGQPSIELQRFYQTDKIHNQYQGLAQVLGKKLDDSAEKARADEAAAEFAAKHGREAVFAVGSRLQGNAFELTLALLRLGLAVVEIYASPTAADFPFIKKIAALAPGIRIYSNLSPSMLHYNAAQSGATIALGRDARYYHPQLKGIDWLGGEERFGYAMVEELFRALSALYEGGDAPCRD